MKWLAIALLLAFLILAGCSQQKEVNEMKELKLSSSAFENSAAIPAKYTCEGENINPPVTVEGIPDGTKTLVLIADDPDAPSGDWVHWVVFNIPPTGLVEEDSVPGTEGINDFGKHSYGGPCPHSGTHRYFFKVYALDAELSTDADATKKDIENWMNSHILAQGELIGVYGRK